MKFGVMGTGMVGNTIGSKLVQLGHQVMMGSRTSNNPKAVDWVKSAGSGASQGTFADAAAFGAVVFNCTSGGGTLPALESAGEGALGSKILVDVANPLDFSRGMPPTLSVCNTDSLGEQIQRRFPSLKVVKTLNTVNISVMVSPDSLSDEHSIFLCGNDPEAKRQVTGLLQSFGWR
jgi:predicted dinucleotide-binding enzyme